MIAKHEVRKYSGGEKVWVGKYKNSHNLLHWHYDCELLFVENGEIDVFCDKEKYTLGKGDAFFISSGVVHYMHAKNPQTVLVVVIFDYNIIKPFCENVSLASPLLSQGYKIGELYLDLKHELTDKRQYYDIAVANKLQKFFLDVFRTEKVQPRTGGAITEAFKNLLGEINEKFEFYSFEEAAKFMGMSQAYFSRFFHGVAGMTFSQYLNYVRIQNAVKIIHADRTKPITEVSTLCGFTIRNFNRTFKEITGYSPKRLPKDFSLDERFSIAGNEQGSPDLMGCELIDYAK